MEIVLGSVLGIGFILFALLGGGGDDDDDKRLDTRPSPKPDDGTIDVVPVDLSDRLDISTTKPMAGRDWTVRKGETLLGSKGTAAQAYGNHPTRIMTAARGISLHPKNAVFLTPSTSDFTRKYLPEGWSAAAYLPHWGNFNLRGNSRKALQTYDDGAYGTLYIPTIAEVRELTGNNVFGEEQ